MTLFDGRTVSLLDTARKGDAVEVSNGTNTWTAATVVRVNRARRVVIVTVFGAPGTRSFPPDAVRRPPDFRPGELAKLRAERRAVAAKPREQLVMKQAAHVVTVGRVKVQTMADQTTRDAIRAIAARDGVTEGAVVRELLTLGFAAKGRA